MPHLLKRTHATSLTDDELILLDVMFELRVPVRSLTRDFFREQWNCTPHQLDDVELRETIRRFYRDGLLKKADGSIFGPYVGMTAEGGRRWEAERLPDWDRFVSEGYREPTTELQLVSIESFTAGTRDNFWRICSDLNVFSFPVAPRVKFRTLKKRQLVYWKPETVTHIAVAIGPRNDDFGGRESWQKYETERTWWRSVRELQKFIQ
jgi:hypothetical protein